MTKEYYFITRWQIRAPLEQVWEAIYNSLEWPLWWRGVKEVRLIKQGDAEGINEIRSYTWKGILPYCLSFRSTLLEKDPFKRLHGTATGELEGEGTWYFFEKDGISCMEYHWKVATTKKWMNRFSFLLRPLFKYNHDLVMKWGAKGLASWLKAELISYRQVRDFSS